MTIRNLLSALSGAAAARIWGRWAGLFPGFHRHPSPAPTPPAAEPDEACQAAPPAAPVAPEIPSPDPAPPAGSLTAAEPAGEVEEGECLVSAPPGAMTAKPDPEAEALRQEAAALKSRIVDLAARQAEMEQLVQRFQYSQYQALGDLLVENLRLRHEYLHLKAARSGRPEDREAARQAAAELENYHQARAGAAPGPAALDDEDQDELKRLYRTVAMRCHPDRVAEPDKAAAHDFFVRTQAAYRENDLAGLRLLHRQVAEGGALETPAAAATDKEQWLQIVDDLQGQATDLILAIQTMQLDDLYRKAIRTHDWEDHFVSIRELLAAECHSLKQQIRAWAAA